MRHPRQDAAIFRGSPKAASPLSARPGRWPNVGYLVGSPVSGPSQNHPNPSSACSRRMSASGRRQLGWLTEMGAGRSSAACGFVRLTQGRYLRLIQSGSRAPLRRCRPSSRRWFGTFASIADRPGPCGSPARSRTKLPSAGVSLQKRAQSSISCRRFSNRSPRR